MSIEQYTNPKIWGPHFWFMFRCISNNYPDNPSEDDTHHTKSFFYSLQYLLPCIVCRESYVEHFNKYPIENYLSNKDQLIKWTEIIYQETNNSKKIDDNHIISPHTETQNVTRPRICNTCGKRPPPDESAFPQPNSENSGPGKGIVGGLRKVLAVTHVHNKYSILAFYNWIRYPHDTPPLNEASNIIKGYIILKNENDEGYYPNYFVINNNNVYITEENAHILTDIVMSKLVYNKFKELSI